MISCNSELFNYIITKLWFVLSIRRSENTHTCNYMISYMFDILQEQHNFIKFYIFFIFLSSGKELLWVPFVGWSVVEKSVENFQTKMTTGAYCAPVLVLKYPASFRKMHLINTSPIPDDYTLNTRKHNHQGQQKHWYRFSTLWWITENCAYL